MAGKSRTSYRCMKALNYKKKFLLIEILKKYYKNNENSYNYKNIPLFLILLLYKYPQI